MKGYFLGLRILVWSVTFSAVLGLGCQPKAPTETKLACYYVATDGSDSNPGTLAKPFATLERARDSIRGLVSLPDGGVTVYLRGGKYFRKSEFSLTTQDSGTAEKPIVYQAYSGEQPRIIGGKQLEPKWFSKVTESSPVWGRLDNAAKGKVMQCNLPEHGITDYGKIRERGFDLWFYDHRYYPSHMELCFNQEMMQLARWPNNNFERTVSVDSNTTFEYSGTRPQRWTQASYPMASGYWKSGWVDRTGAIADINTVTKRITLVERPERGLRADKPWYALNLLEEIDIPGEYYLERDTGMLYLWPPNDISEAEILVSTLGENKEPLVDMNDVEYLTLRDITFEIGRFDGVRMKNSSNVLVDGCVVRNLGGNGVVIFGGYNSGVQNCEMYGLNQGIGLEGGDRKSLTPCNHFARNNHIHHYGRWERCYRPAVYLRGVGGEASHNLIHDAPHFAIWCYFNSHLVQFNEIYRVCTETMDSGAIYAGYGWSNCGNIIRHNFVHNIYSPEGHVRALYLDGCTSENTLFGNILYNGGYWTAIWYAGGRDNVSENNVIAKCWSAHVGYPCGRSERAACGNLNDLKQFDYQNPPWSTAYPKLAAIPNDCTLPEFKKYGYAGGCVFSSNIGWQHGNADGKFMIDCTGLEYYEDISDNIEDQDPLFYDEPNLIMALRDDSPAYTIPGFKRIPWEQIGILDKDKAVRPIPPDGWKDVEIDSSLYWAPAFEAKSRNVYLGTSFDKVKNIAAGTYKGTLGEPNYQLSGIKPDTTYYWRVEERNANGDVPAAGDVWSFTTRSGKAIEPEPADGTNDVEVTVTLRWTSGAGAVCHDVYLGTTPGAAEFKGTFSGEPKYTPAALEPNSTYYWSIDERDLGGEILETGDVWSFTTRSGKAIEPQPTNGAVGIDTTLTLSWTSGAGAFSHDVYLGTAAVPGAGEFKGNVSESKYTPATPEPDTVYYWRIDERDLGGGFLQTGNVWRFTTESELAKNPNPADTARNVQREVVLMWKPGPVALSHDVYIGTNFNNVKDANNPDTPPGRGSQSLGTNSYDPGGLGPNTTYYWRIDESNDSATWKGDVWCFTTRLDLSDVNYIDSSNITITASSSWWPDSLVHIIDGLGLTGQLHDAISSSPYNSWINSGNNDGTSYHPGTVTGHCWVACEFDRVYQLSQLWVWNWNQDSTIDRCWKDVTVQYSSDGSTWTTLDGPGYTYQLDKASGVANYAHDWAGPGSNEFDFGGANAKYVVLTAHSSWGEIWYGLSELRFYIFEP